MTTYGKDAIPLIPNRGLSTTESRFKPRNVDTLLKRCAIVIVQLGFVQHERIKLRDRIRLAERGHNAHIEPRAG